jgi:hypothetical protein
MSLESFLGLSFAAASAKAQKKQGEVALQNAMAQAYDLQTEVVIQGAMAAANENTRRKEYDLAMAANNAVFSAFGNVNSSSTQARLEADKEILGEDIYAIMTQGEINMYKTRSQRRVVIEEGYARKTAANIGAFTTMATGIMNFAESYSREGQGN